MFPFVKSQPLDLYDVISKQNNKLQTSNKTKQKNNNRGRWKTTEVLANNG